MTKEKVTWSGLFGMDPDFAPKSEDPGSDVLYEKCLHCHLFVEPNSSWDEYQTGVTRFVHLSRGNAADERFEDHDAEPSGLLANLATWRIFGPSAMRERFVTGLSGLTIMEVICERHGGPWGADPTCERCTYENGRPRPVVKGQP